MFNTLLVQPLTNGLIVFYRIFGGNLGLAIIGFSLFLRFVLNPLTKPYMESMKKMKTVAPKLEKLKKKHKDDRVKLAQAQSELYRQKGINPGSGCLPYILQIVVLIAFFNVFSKTIVPDANLAEQFNKLLYEPLRFAKDAVVNTNFLYLDVRTPDTFQITGLPFPVPGPLLVLAAIVQFLSAKITAPFVEAEEAVAKKTKGEADDIQVAMQKSMIYTFPLLTIVFGMRFSSGLALYWLMFSLFQAAQQYKSSGWGGLTPWIKRAGLLKSEGKKGK